jgi:hypothetical protein
MGFQSNEIEDTQESVDYRTFSDQQSQERWESWFEGTLMRMDKKAGSDFYRLVRHHNQITREETGFNLRFRANNAIARRLAEFYPLKWLNEISNVLRSTKPSKIVLRYNEDRIYAYLAYIDLLLIFRGLTILDSTLVEISESLGIELSRQKIRTYRLKLLRIYPDLKQKWLTLRAHTPAKTLLASVIRIMNNELFFPTSSHKEIFSIKQKTLEYAKRLTDMERIRHMKCPESWAYALCLKAYREFYPKCSKEIFRSLNSCSFDTLENKRWQLDKLF